MDVRLKMLEVIYRFDLDESTHAHLVQETASLIWEKRGPVAFIRALRAPNGGLQLSPISVTRDCGRDYPDMIQRVLPNVPTDECCHFYTLPSMYMTATTAETSGILANKVTMQLTHQAGIPDVRGFASGTFEGGVVSLVTFCDEISSITDRDRTHWQPLAAHLSAAWRLRQRLTSGVEIDDLTDAVLMPDGRYVDGTPRTRSRAMRERLQDAVRSREAERSARTMDGGIWSELVHGNWTLIDRFDSDRQRNVLAIRNAPAGRSLCCLTKRELEVLEQARSGASNKEIALNMNLSAASVTRVLQCAARKLNATIADMLRFSRAEVVKCREILLGMTTLSVFSQCEPTEPQYELSDAEKIVAAAVLRGCSNHEIATMRGRSMRTVANQLASIFEKVGVHSRRELVARMGGHDAACGTNE